MSHVFGPVPSRRLGFSLGVDAVPFKVCTLNCVYCQVGRTSLKTLKRKEWIDPNIVLHDIKNIIAEKKKIDFITFAGSGEPTLNAALGKMIERIKGMTSIPVAVLSNGTLLHLPEVRKDLMAADLVVPSLDAVTPKIFQKINRPHRELTVTKLVTGLKNLRKEFHGQIWLEVMIVRGINDSIDELKKIAAVIKKCKPDKIQLNTVVRPSVENYIEPAPMETLVMAKNLFDGHVEIIEEFQSDRHDAMQADTEEAIIELLKRRPSPMSDLSKSLGLHESIIKKFIVRLVDEQRIKEIVHGGIRFYQI